jgi:hypothetical protein
MLATSDGAPWLVRAIGELWPKADLQRCTVHTLRNLMAKLPKKPELRERVHDAYWTARCVSGPYTDSPCREWADSVPWWPRKRCAVWRSTCVQSVE